MRHFAVIGLGRFGASVARTLAEKGEQVLAIDKDEEFVHEVMDSVSKAVCLDATDEKAARSIGLHKVDVAVCGIGADLEASILVTLLLKELAVPVIVCKAVNQAHKKVLEKIGATRVILPETDMGERIAESLISMSDTVLEHISLPGNSSIIEIVVPEEFAGKTLRDLDVRTKYGVNIIAIKQKTKTSKGKESQEEETVNITPQATDILGADDVIIVFGENAKINALKHKNES